MNMPGEKSLSKATNYLAASELVSPTRLTPTFSTNKGPSAKPMTERPSSPTQLRVVARIRPMSTFEAGEGSKEALTSSDQRYSSSPTTEGQPELIEVRGDGIRGGKRWYELDAVLDKSCTQEEVYAQSGASKAVREDVFRGYNSTIMAYGQTGAGKTYTMGTAVPKGSELAENSGIIARASEDLFKCVQEKCDGNARVELSFLEIYNDELRDMLTTEKTDLKIRETLDGEVYVSGLTSKAVSCSSDVAELLAEGSSRRAVAVTAISEVSSRSHAICTMKIDGIVDGSDGDEMDKFTSKLTFVDLAGSERLKKTGSTGSRKQEGININKGLFSLSQVVSALVDQSKKRGSPSRRPPYRDSKLTRLLQDSLGGNSRTIMITCVSPADCSVDESISTLRYASSARRIKGRATANLIKAISPAEASVLMRENQLLKNEVLELQEALRSLSRPPLARRLSTDSDSARSLVSAVAVPVEDYRESAEATQRIRDLEDEVKSLKQELHTARATKEEAVNAAIEIPAMKVEIEMLREKVRKSLGLVSENQQLLEELHDARADAASARTAACRISDIMDHIRDLKDHNDAKMNGDDIEQGKKEATMEFFVDAILKALIEEDTEAE